MDSPVGVCVLPPAKRNFARTVAYGQYVHEILAHAGVCYTSVSMEELPEALPGLRLLLTVGEANLPEDLSERLEAWVRDGGGAWLSVGGVCGKAELFGAQVEPPAYSSWGGGTGTLGEGYLQVTGSDHPLLAPLSRPLHYFGGIPVRPAGAAAVLADALDAHGRPTPRAAVLESAPGKGRCLLVAPDITGTVVRVQQGIAVTRDGVSSPDGTAPIEDEMLKSGDGGVLDWLLDREPVPDVPGLSAFLQPVADQWRELLLRAVFHLATAQNVTLPVLWLYPRSVPALAHLSHDTDGNDPAKAWRLLEVLRVAGVNSTWCVILPGYDQEIIEAIRSAGHELATHYDAVSDGCPWGEAEFDAQWRRLTEMFGDAAPVSNKNHYLRWEGDTELWEWCAKRGIGLDQSKGASKTGEAGFNFGTCHPYFPVAPDGSPIDVLELATPTQDLNVFGPEALLAPLLAAALRHHGILHLLFHPAHIDKEGVAEAIGRAVEAARAHGMEWWTVRQLGAWERARRQVRWGGYGEEPHPEGTRVTVSLQAGGALAGATLLWLCPTPGECSAQAFVEEQTSPAAKVTRWGFPFHAVTFDLEENQTRTVHLTVPGGSPPRAR